MKIKSKLLTGSVLFVIISAILALLFTNSYISVKSTSNYINSIGAEVAAGEVYINKTGDTDKISTIQGKQKMRDRKEEETTPLIISLKIQRSSDGFLTG